MGCDYYIVKVLQIEYYTDNNDSEIEVSRDRCYYIFDYDEDEDDYDEQMNAYIENTLIPKMKPIILFSMSTFNKVTSEIKYKTIIEDELKNHNKTWSDIKIIRKIEKRYQI
jgi:hypothetical protein